MGEIAPVSAEVSPESSLLLDALAANDERDAFSYLNEALALGLVCADAVILNQQRGLPSFVYFEKAPNIFDPMKVEFAAFTPDAARVSPPDSDFAVKDPFTNDEQLTVNFENETGPRIQEAASALGVSVEDFIEYSLFLRWRWGLTKAMGGRTIMNSGVQPPPHLANPE